MRIKGPSDTSKTTKSGKSGGASKTGDAAFQSMVGDTGSSGGAAAASGMSSMSGAGTLDALISLQEMGDMTSEEAKSRAKKRGREILDRLDDIRMGLLSGGISERILTDLTQKLAEQRGGFEDPQLTAVLDEIDLRAQVELAKFQQNR